MAWCKYIYNARFTRCESSGCIQLAPGKHSGIRRQRPPRSFYWQKPDSAWLFHHLPAFCPFQLWSIMAVGRQVLGNDPHFCCRVSQKSLKGGDQKLSRPRCWRGWQTRLCKNTQRLWNLHNNWVKNKYWQTSYLEKWRLQLQRVTCIFDQAFISLQNRPLHQVYFH